MRFFIKSFQIKYFASALFASLVSANSCLALESRYERFSFPILPTNIAAFARYYAPYVIQAAASYACDGEYSTCVNANPHAATSAASPDADPDVNYAVSKVIADPEDAAKARRIFRGWRYQFGSDGGNLGCIDPADTECEKDKSERSWSFGAGPLFQVWGLSKYPHADNERCTEFSIAFRGTTTNAFGLPTLKDAALGDAPPLNKGGVDDYYHQLKRNLSAIVRRIEAQPCYKHEGRPAPQLVTVGHSLGGGLAEFAALAHNRIAKAFSIDPSPVTGANIVDQKALGVNVVGLTIDRIYQEGEVLDKLRNIKEGYPPFNHVCDPRVRSVKVDANEGSPLQLHSIDDLASVFVQRAYEDFDTESRLTAYQAPDTRRIRGVLTSTTTCVTRYHYIAPDPNETEAITVASAGSDRGFTAQYYRVSESSAPPRLLARQARRWRDNDARMTALSEAGAYPMDSAPTINIGWPRQPPHRWSR